MTKAVPAKSANHYIDDIDTYTGRKRPRKSFSPRKKKMATMPGLIDMQTQSYKDFLQTGVAKDQRQLKGLQSVFMSTFPVKDNAGRSQLEFFGYDLLEPKYDVVECQQRGMTYASPLRLTLRLAVWEIDEDTGARSIRDIKEQEVYMGDLPMMTENGTFIINGDERVVVSQIQRPPGVSFELELHPTGKPIYHGRIIPARGAWFEIKYDLNQAWGNGNV